MRAHATVPNCVSMLLLLPVLQITRVESTQCGLFTIGIRRRANLCCCLVPVRTISSKSSRSRVSCRHEGKHTHA